MLQGGANIEQARDLSSADLAWFTGVPVASDHENQNPIRDGLEIVRAQLNAYGQC